MVTDTELYIIYKPDRICTYVAVCVCDQPLSTGGRKPFRSLFIATGHLQKSKDDQKRNMCSSAM